MKFAIKWLARVPVLIIASLALPGLLIIELAEDGDFNRALKETSTFIIEIWESL